VRVTVKLIGLPSVADAAEIANIGARSSLVIVPVAVPLVVLKVAPPVGALSVAVKVSLPSNRAS